MTKLDSKKPRIIALIPARAGSKGFPGKNLAKLDGVPLVERAIRFAQSNPYISEVVVSSNSDEVINLATKLGSISHVRPEEFATDGATATQVVQDFISFYKEKLHLQPTDYILYLQPTSPLRKSSQLEEAVSILSNTVASVVSVSELEYHPYKSITLDAFGLVVDLTGLSSLSSNRQDLPKAYRCDGNIFLFQIQKFLELNRFPIVGSRNILSKKGFGVDVDTAEDLKLLEVKIHMGLIELE